MARLLPHCACQALAWAFASSLLGCSSEENGSPSTTPQGSPEEHPAASLPSVCDVPPAPAPVGRSVVVGTGTPASCTNAALQAATSAGGDITFACGPDPIVIAITTSITVEQNAAIDGAGRVTLDGQGTTRIMTANSEVNLALRGLTFTRGLGTASDGTKSGGAVRGGWRGSLDIRACTFTDNQAGTAGEEGGGAIYTPSRTTMTIVGCRFEHNRGGTGGAVHNLLSGLTVVDSVFAYNESVTDGGGGLYTDGASEQSDDDVGGLIVLCGCRFQGNAGRKQGGGAYLFAYHPDRIEVNRCVFEQNQVLSAEGSGALGGGLRVGNAQLDLGQSLFVANHSDRHGGGLWVDGHYPSYVTNTTFVGNDAGVPGVTEGGYGGAISGANLVMLNLTLADNWAVNSGGAIFNEDTTSALDNSILSNNRADNQWQIKQACRASMAGTRNLQWPDPGSDVVCTEGTTLVDPRLGALLDNGGATPTMAPAADSPALNQGGECPPVDQRGQPRAAACDLGAVEL